jgi:hypothetical protein
MGDTFTQGARFVRRSPVLLMLLGVNFFVGTASEGFDRLGDAHLLKNFVFPSLGALKPVVWFGILSVCGSLLSLLVVHLFQKRLDALNSSPSASARALLVLNAVSIVSVLAFGLAGGFWMAFAALMLRAVVNAIVWPLYGNWVVQQVESKTRATVLSMLNQTNALGQTAGGPIVGLVGRTYSLRAALVVTGLLLSPALGLYAAVLQQSKTAPALPETAEADALAEA